MSDNSMLNTTIGPRVLYLSPAQPAANVTKPLNTYGGDPIICESLREKWRLSINISGRKYASA